MRSDLAIAMTIASRQHGIVTRSNLFEVGFSADQVARLVSSSSIHRVVDGAYRFASHSETELGRCAAMSLSRPGVTIAGPTAARIWGFRRVGHDHSVHVICKPGAQPGRVPWLIPYRTACLADSDIMHMPDGIRLTSQKRTVIDMVRYSTDNAIVSMIEQGLDKQWFTESEIRTTASAIATPGRPFAKRFLALLSVRIEGGAAGSDWESLVGDALRARNLPGLVRQHALTVRGYGTLRFDLAIPALRWALEIDVHPSHFTREGAANDKFRDRCCAEAGWLVQRVGEPDLRHRFDATIDSLERQIQRRRATLGPSLRNPRTEVA
jgi:very-short-patch-repair endonuclease